MNDYRIRRLGLLRLKVCFCCGKGFKVGDWVTYRGDGSHMRHYHRRCFEALYH